MFKRKPAFKPASAIKSSERRRLLKSICDQFRLNEDTLATDAKYNLTPKSIRSCKVQLSNGEIHNLYLDDDSKPLWIELKDNGKLVPTVFTLWTSPYICPILLTPELTIEYLQNGADLMIPGIFPPYPSGGAPGQVVAIATLKNPTAPVAVGIALIDCSKLEELGEGKAVAIANVIGDGLYNSHRQLITVPKEELDLTVPTVQEEEEEPARSSNNQDQVFQETPEQEEVTQLAEATSEVKVEETSSDSDSEPSIEETDNAFRKSLLQVLKKSIDKPLDLPITSSGLLASHMLENLPYTHPSIQIKKSSWKKATKFFKAMEKEGLLKCRERNGELIITQTFTDHELVRTFETFRPKSYTGDKLKAQPSLENKQRVVTKEFWQPKAIARGLFGITSRSDVFLTTDQVVSGIRQYAIDHNLVSSGKITIDEILHEVLGGDKTPVPFNKLLDRLPHAFILYHKIIRDESDEPKLKFVKGPIPKILITGERRMGNKVVTIVSNVEPFRIDTKDLAEHLRVACASSTTVNNGRQGSELKEIMVQGLQFKAIIGILTNKYGLRENLVEVNDKTKKKKKK